MLYVSVERMICGISPHFGRPLLPVTDYETHMIHDPKVVFFPFFFYLSQVYVLYILAYDILPIGVVVSMSGAKDQRSGRPRTGKET